MSGSPRLSVRALIVQQDRLLLVNATADKGDDRWCTPGGGLNKHEPVVEALQREVTEETGLHVSVGELYGVSEYCDYSTDFHQIDLYFKCTLVSGTLSQEWRDVAGIVNRRSFFSVAEMKQLNVVPSFLCDPFWLKTTPPLPIYKGREDRISVP